MNAFLAQLKFRANFFYDKLDFLKTASRVGVLYGGHEQQKRSNADVVSYLYAGAAGTSEGIIGSFE